MTRQRFLPRVQPTSATYSVKIPKIMLFCSSLRQSTTMALCERQVDSALAALTIDAHLLRFANQDSGDFGGFLAGTNAIANVGRIEDKPLSKEYFSERKKLVNVVKQKYRILCCTLATANIGFFNDKEFPARAAVLVVDEALQATDLAIIETRIVLDPRRIILAGTTHNSGCTVARPLLNGPGCARSFESCLSEASPRTSLTSNTARLPTNMPELRSTIPSRSPMRPRPTVAMSSHNVHFFNIRNSVTKKVGITKLSANQLEPVH